MITFVKIDGKWINPQAVASVTPTGRESAGFSKITLTSGVSYTVACPVETVIAKLEHAHD